VHGRNDFWLSCCRDNRYDKALLPRQSLVVQKINPNPNTDLVKIDLKLRMSQRPSARHTSRMASTASRQKWCKLVLPKTLKIPKNFRPDSHLVDDTTTAHLDMHFTKLGNLKQSVFRLHLIGFQLCAIKRACKLALKRPKCYVSHESKLLYAKSKQ